DTAGFEAEMEKQRARARAAQKKELITVSETSDSARATQFAGYERENLTSFTSTLDAIIEGDGFDFAVFAQTPFYAEKGGQVGDTGSVEICGKTFEILDTKVNSARVYLHKIAKGSLGKDMLSKEAVLNVDASRRRAIQRHHSATHLLNWALREVLGGHVQQAGSFVNDERLRFDFTHFEAITPEQLLKIERLANSKILENLYVRYYEVPFNEVPKDCLAFFGDKYGAIVRVIDMGGFHSELCGGTHVSALGEIGMIKIVSESAIAAGTRRIEAVAGAAAYGYAENLQGQISQISARLSCKPSDAVEKLERLAAEKAELEREIKSLKKESAGKAAEELAGGIVEFGETSWIVKTVKADEANVLRELAVGISKSAGRENLAIVLGAEISGKGSILALCSDAAVKSGVKAGELIKKIAPLMDGRGGGKPDFAMGGGSASKLKSALDAFAASLK
ncbi:MAG: alanine--tRNA ligase, partial [Opitutales bacterium]|nr:alanine--tRNA ligase [Opitutales bacterium]